MASFSVKELLEAGVHYGHHASRWNPKMEKYIYGKRNAIHIINLVETVRGLLKACKFLKKLAARGEDVLLVGTKRQSSAVVVAEGQRGDIPHVSERWLGGTLTNFQTIRSRLGRLIELEELESSGRLSTYSKKEGSTLMREKRKILRNLDGLRKLERQPGAIVVIDPRREKIAVMEANKLGIPVIGLIDSDSDPDRINIPIPGNDDAIKSIQLITSMMVNAVLEGKVQARGTVTPLHDSAEEAGETEASEAAAAGEAVEAAASAEDKSGEQEESSKTDDSAETKTDETESASKSEEETASEEPAAEESTEKTEPKEES